MDEWWQGRAETGPLLVGKLNGAATVENNMVVLQNTEENFHVIQPVHSWV